MTERAEERPEYAWLRELKETQGDELRRRYGAHSIGIGRKRVGDRKTDQLALIFYVAAKGSASRSAEAVPNVIRFVPKGAGTPVEVHTDVRESPAAEFEGGPG
jgi:hypothetical protein